MPQYLKFFLGFLGAALIGPAFLPGEFETSRSININTSQTDAFSYLVNLESWSEWSPWLAMDPEANQSFHGIPGVVGSYNQWKGEKIGAGRQTLTALTEHDYIETKLEFTEPNASPATGYIKIKPADSGVHVTWGMRGSLSYPVERVFNLFMMPQVEESFEKGLENLKHILESSKSSEE